MKPEVMPTEQTRRRISSEISQLDASAPQHRIPTTAKMNAMRLILIFALVSPAISQPMASSDNVGQIFLLDNGLMDKRFEQPGGMHFGFGKRSEDFMGGKGIRLGFGKRNEDDEYMNKGFRMGFGKRNKEDDFLSGKGMRLGFGKRSNDDFVMQGLRMGFGKRHDDDFMTKGMRMGFGKRSASDINRYIVSEDPLPLPSLKRAAGSSLESMEFTNPSWQHLQRFNLGLGRR